MGLTAITSVAIQLPAFAAVTVPTNGGSGGGTCWKAGTPYWCPKLWTGTSTTHREMDFNFNDHTDEGTDPRPTWAAGMAAAGEDWENPTISPVTWTWTATATNMDVGSTT